MDSPLAKFDTEANFWTCNPQFKIKVPFKDIYDGDKSSNKEKSSRLMWGFALLLDPVYSIYKVFRRPEREKIVVREWLNTDDFKEFSWGQYHEALETFENLTTSPARRALADWNNKIQDRSEFLRTTSYTLDTEEFTEKGKKISVKGSASQLDKMMIDTPKIYAEYQRVLREMDQETAERAMGDGEMSATEKGMI